jgi:hypothetical protein
LTNLNITDPTTGAAFADMIGIDVPVASYVANTTSVDGDSPSAIYAYQVSLFNGNDDIVAYPGVSAQIEVGAGGTATAVGGTASTLYLWHQKTLIWENNGSHNTLEFNPLIGAADAASGELTLNLLTGLGTNPYGGTLQISNVDTVGGGSDAGEYILANNDGDKIVAGAYSGNVAIIGGTGNDTLTGSAFGPLNLLVAGPGTSTLSGSLFGGTNIYVYGKGVVTITNFHAGAGSGDTIDLSSVASVSSFAQVMADSSPNGANTVLTFGAGETLTIDNVATSALAAGNFIFAPIVAFAGAPQAEADTGTTVPIVLTLSDVVSVNTSGGTPSLTLSDGGTATYDAAASDLVGHLMVFDDTVAAGDHSPDLKIASLNSNGAIIQDASAHPLAVSSAANQLTGLQINPSPLTVAGVSVLPAGEADAGQTVTITLHMTEPVVVQEGLTFDLELNDGAIASYNPAASDPAAGTLGFSYTIGTSDHIANLTIEGVQLVAPADPNPSADSTVVKDNNGYVANLANASGAATGLAIAPPVYVGTLAANAAASPTAVGEEADAGQTFQITLTLNHAVTINTSGSTPTLTLSDGSTATLDAAVSNGAAGTLVFDDTVGASDHSPNVEIASVNLNGATVQTASGVAANFAAAIDTPIGAGVQIGPSPLTVTSTSATIGTVGGVSIGTIALTMSENVTATVQPSGFSGSNAAGVTLNNGETAYFAPYLSSGDQLVFTFAPQDDANVSIAAVDLSAVAGGTETFQDTNGYNADFSAALNVPLGLATGEPLYVAAFDASPPSSEVLGGRTFQITLDMSEAVTVSGGTPAIALNDGGTATYDAGLSVPASGTLVFDDTPRAGEEFPTLGINGVNLNGAAITDASANKADFSALAGLPLQLQIGPASVLAASSTLIGKLTAGEITNFDLVMSTNVSIDTTGGVPTLTLSNGAVATYDSGLSAVTASDGPSSIGQIIFDYTVGPDDGTANLTIASVNLNGAVITDVVSGAPADLSAATTNFLGASVACFVSGTMLSTGAGEIEVERLAVGDQVLTRFNGMRPVTWIGHRAVDCRAHPRPLDVWPVRVAAGAFGAGLPNRDLRLSPDHSVFVDGVLIPIRHLVNGTTIVREKVGEVVYWHVAVEQHDILLAQRLPCESYLDVGNRDAFANGGLATHSHPHFASQRREAWACAPMTVHGPILERVRRELAERAAAAGLQRAA